MSQRKEDYMSTKNPGGNRRGGTDAMPNDPMSHMKMGPNHAYLGHFRQARFLKEGHNILTPLPGDLQPAPAPVPFAEPGGYATPPATPTVKPGVQTPLSPPTSQPTLGGGFQTPAGPAAAVTNYRQAREFGLAAQRTDRANQLRTTNPMRAAKLEKLAAVHTARAVGSNVKVARAVGRAGVLAARENLATARRRGMTVSP